MPMSAMKAAFKLPSAARFINKEGRDDFRKKEKNNFTMKEFKDIKVAVAGTGYVGLSIATLLSQHHHVSSRCNPREGGENQQ